MEIAKAGVTRGSSLPTYYAADVVNFGGFFFSQRCARARLYPSVNFGPLTHSLASANSTHIPITEDGVCIILYEIFYHIFYPNISYIYVYYACTYTGRLQWWLWMLILDEQQAFYIPTAPTTNHNSLQRSQRFSHPLYNS